MKIAYLMQAGVPDVRKHPLSGPANHVRQVFKELEYLGHQVRLLAMLDGQIWKSDNLEDYEPVSVRWLDKGPFKLFEKVVRSVQYKFQLPYASFFESMRFALACRQVLAGYDLLYERMGWVGYGGSLAARWLSVPLVIEVNGDHLDELESLGIAPKGMQRRLSVSLMNKVAVNWSSHVVTTGDGWRDRFIKRWGVDDSKVETVENGSELVKLLNREQLRAFQVDEEANGVTTVAYIGGFHPWQGVTVLIRAFAQALGRGAQARLLLIGSGPTLSELEQLIHELNIGEHVTFTGRLAIHELPSYLTKTDIGVSPYCGRVEFSGLKLLDYKAAGLTTIASGQNGQPAILEHGKTGWIVPPCDEHALCEAIVRLSTDVQLRKQIGQAARIEAEQLHGWHHTAKQLHHLFHKVTAKDSLKNQ